MCQAFSPLCMVSLAVEGPREKVVLGSEEIFSILVITDGLCLLPLIVEDGGKGSD